MTSSLRHSDSRSPSVPLTKGRLSYIGLIKRTKDELGDDHVGAFAGSLTYHTLLAIFPFTIFVLSVLFLAGQQSLLTDGISNLQESGALSASAASTISTQVEEIASSRSGALGFSVVISILTALWATSGAFRSIMEATNVMYEVEETRGFVRRYATSIILSIVVAALFIVALGLVVAGPAVADQLGDIGRWLWLVLQWPVLIAFVLLGLSLVYYYAPSAEQKFKFVSPGSIIAAAVWLVFSLVFSYYVSNFGSYNKVYGTLAGAIILMLYVYYTSFIFLFGAEANQIIESAAPEGKDPGDKR
ncbi:MAG: ribonuclease [Thermoleophilia bacterium]|nr:ribonuclease [Thermoleophilia bacterium]